MKPSPQSLLERKVTISKAISSQYNTSALFDNEVGFLPQLPALTDPIAWKAVSATSLPATTEPLDLKAFRVYAFEESSGFKDVAEFICSNHHLLCGLCMTAQKGE